MIPHLEIISGGLSSTIQDYGRFGHQSIGVSPGGALDPAMLRVANVLVGNPQAVGAIEVRIQGPVMRVMAHSVRIALAGTTSFLEILEPRQEYIPAHRSVYLSRGQVFRVGVTADTACCYLAAEGGFDVPFFYNSQSTYQLKSSGALGGQALRDGERLPLSYKGTIPGLDSLTKEIYKEDESKIIRVVLGPQADHFTDTGLHTFLNSEYEVSHDSNRMGLRATGPEIEHAEGYNIISDGITTGSIQVPGTGLPIILLADRQTTGGYPKIGTVISSDLRRLGRMTPGTTFRFREVSIKEAEDISRTHEKQIKKVINSIRPIHDELAAINVLYRMDAI